VETPASGEPVIRDTTVPVHVVASLAKGETIEEILEDYPSLTRAQVENAIEYAKAYPKKGRPYPARSFKRTDDGALRVSVMTLLEMRRG